MRKRRIGSGFAFGCRKKQFEMKKWRRKVLVGITHEEKNEKEICRNMYFIGNNTNRTGNVDGYHDVC